MPIASLFEELAVVLCGYLLGCFATGYYLVRWRTGQDLRQIASGATGGRNAARALGWQGAAITGLFDILKGCLAVWIALALHISALGVGLTMIAVVLGHIWPVQLGFHGGKGLSAAYGAVLVHDLRLALLVVMLAAAFALFSRRVSLSTLAAIALAPVLAFFTELLWPDVAVIAVIVALILYAHRSNLRELLAPPRSAKSESQ